jgi:hypothetical protein
MVRSRSLNPSELRCFWYRRLELAMMTLPQLPPASPNLQLAQKRNRCKELRQTVAIKVAAIALVTLLTGYCDSLPLNVAIQSLVSLVMETWNERAAQQLNEKLERLRR